MSSLFKIIVTGSHGFLGRHVARGFAAEGHYIIGIGHGEWSSSEWKAWGLSEWHRGEVTVENLCSYGGKPDVVVHCAGSGSVAFSVEQPRRDFHRTVVSTTEVLDFIRMHAPEARLVYPSSAAVYGCALQVPISEDCPPAPVSPYGVHKLMAEDLCRLYGRSFGIHSAVLRLFSVYGPGLRKQLLWDACHKLQAGQVSFGGTGQEMRDWLHVEDAVRLIRVAVERAAPACPTVNGGSGVGVEVNMVLNCLQEGLGHLPPCKFSGEARIGDPLHLVADRTRALAWEWRPEKFWKDGILEYADWYNSLK